MRRPFTVVGIVSLLVTQTPTQLQESRAITLERTSYFPGAPKCIHAGTDHPWLMLTAVVRGQAKTVRYYTGCYGGGATRPVWAGAARPDTAPDPGVLLRLAALVDSVAGTRKWLRSRSR